MNEIRRISGNLWREYHRTETMVRAHSFPWHELTQFNIGTVYPIEVWNAGERREDLEAKS